VEEDLELAWISWKTQPEICWALPPKMKNAMHLRIRACGDNPDRFLIPKSRTGIIKPEKYPEFCVDAVGGSSTIQYYKCADANPTNLQWLLPVGATGVVKPEHRQSKCVDIPGGKTADDTYMQQWDCTAKLVGNEEFVIHKVHDTSDTEVVYITWDRHPDTCWALGLTPKIKNALHLRIRKCGDQPDKFIVPKNGTGIIRPLQYPDYCLDAIKGGSTIQYYKCNEANSQSNLPWVLPTTFSGAIKPQHSPDKCVDVPNGKTADDTYLQQWSCHSSMKNHETFTLHKVLRSHGNGRRTLGKFRVGLISVFFLLSFH